MSDPRRRDDARWAARRDLLVDRLRWGVIVALVAELFLAPGSPGARLGSTVSDLVAVRATVVTTATAGATTGTRTRSATARVAAATTKKATANVSSAVTVSGRGAFASLKVTVSQTTHLVDQSVTVTWSGGKPTNDRAAFDIDYLQLMQCWGDTIAGPDRTQCEFGGTVASDTRGGAFANSRQLTTAAYVDKAEPLTAKSASGDQVFVPFRPARGAVVSGIDVLKNPYYDNTTTNEQPYQRTRNDGQGYTTFETVTYREAPGLDCADLVGGKPRRCWLVIVPRGETEVDGTPRAQVLANGSHRLDTSPLSTTNWKNRLVVPLSFEPVGNACPLTAQAKPLAGTEMVAEAIYRWQPALCAGNAPSFDFSQVADAVADRTLATDTPGMEFVTSPVDPADVPEDRVYTYAPVSVSGLTVAVMIERQTPVGGSAATHLHDGERITSVNLTQRLVAKLLTQSYVFGAPGLGTARYLQKNPSNITTDPDFLAINPAFKGLQFQANVELLVPGGLSGTTELLWNWITSDQTALDFLAGLPDPWGMRINPFYQGLPLPRQDFAKIDPYCAATFQQGAPALCTLDEHPFSQDLHDAARSAARGDSLMRTFWDANARPPTWKKKPLQLSGQRQLLAVTDSATAQRFGLVTARLRNAAGQFVAPTATSLRAGLAHLVPSAVPGVPVTDPATAARGAYPLTVLTYAVTAPNILSPQDATAYANLVRYAVGGGQVAGTAPGTLPDGYVALPAPLRAAARHAAALIAARVGPPTHSTTQGSTTTARSSSSTGRTHRSGGNGSGTGGGTTPNDTPAPVTTTSAPADSTTPTVTSHPAVRRTPADSIGGGRFALVISLILGMAGAVLGPGLSRLARRLDG